MTLIHYINDFEKNKKKILEFWMRNESVIEVLKNFDMDRKVFLKEYAIGVLDYYICVVKNEKKIGDCPVIEELLNYLEKHNISSSQLFILCSGFRNAMVEYMYFIKIQSFELEKELNYYYEQNFSGVLEKYTKTIKEINKSTDIIDKYVIMSRTDSKGIIQTVSNAFCDISGYTNDELIGQPHNIIRHPDMPKEIYKELWETIQSGKSWSGEVKNRKKDGRFYWVEVIITPNFDLDGNIISYDAIRQDITSKKEVENQQHMLIEQSKSAAMGEMISMIAHQWRQPLQAVSILVQKLPLTKMIEGEITDDLLDSVVDEVGKQLEYMSKTIDDFRDFFKPDKEKELVLAERAVDKAIEFLAYLFKVDSIKLTINSHNDDNYVLIHFNEVVQVLINIIKNSRDAMIEKITEDRFIAVDLEHNDESVIIRISDNAGGIPENIIKRIFEPYFSTKSNKNGTGLGLYMSKTIIEQHCNGRLTVSNSDVGAIFKIELPLNRSE